MNKSKYGWAASLVVIFLGTAYLWATAENRSDPLNKPYAFAFLQDGALYWFELKSENGKVEGTLHQQKVMEEIGKVPMIEKKTYTIKGKTTDVGYAFKAKNGLKFETWFFRDYLVVKRPGEKYSKLYTAVDEKELASFEKALQQDFEMADYHSEEKEKTRIREFFTALRSVYGYLYSAEDGSFQLFVKFDEALLQGELSGSLLMVDDSGQETKYDVNGVTDGHKVRLYTRVDGRETKLQGDFHEDATGFELSFWKTAGKQSFHAVTEEEYKRVYEEFKTKVK